MSQTNPLARAWKTTEGVVTVGLGVLVGVLSGIDPSALPHKYAAIVTGGLAVSLQLSRSWIKANASASALEGAPNSQAALLAEVSAVDPEPVVAPPVVDPANPPVQSLV